MRIGVNAQLWDVSGTYRSAGISHYTGMLLRALARVDQDREYTVYTPVRDVHLGSNFRLVHGVLPTRHPVARLLWEQLALPVLSRHAHVLHCLANVCPVLAICPTVLTVHDLAFLRLDHSHLPLKQSYLRALVPLSARRAHVVVAVSESTRRDVVELLGVDPSRVVCIPEAASEEFRWLGDTASGRIAVEEYVRRRGLPEHFILYLGTLEPRKNIPALLCAYRELVRRYRSAEECPRLVIAGPRGWMCKDIREGVQRMGLADMVLFPGFIPSEELTLLMNAALCFIYLSRYEGFGLPVLEAMACGLPVVVNNSSSLPEVVGDAGVIVDAEVPAGVADALHTIVTSAEVRRQLNHQSLARSALFSWDETARRTLAVYDALRS